MKLYCKGQYHNGPYGLHFSGPGVVEIDDPKAEFLLRDAPENFTKTLPAPVKAPETTPQAPETPDAPTVEPETPPETKAPEAPPVDKQVKEPRKKK